MGVVKDGQTRKVSKAPLLFFPRQEVSPLGSDIIYQEAPISRKREIITRVTNRGILLQIAWANRGNARSDRVGNSIADDRPTSRAE